MTDSTRIDVLERRVRRETAARKEAELFAERRINDLYEQLLESRASTKPVNLSSRQSLLHFFNLVSLDPSWVVFLVRVESDSSERSGESELGEQILDKIKDILGSENVISTRENEYICGHQNITKRQGQDLAQALRVGILNGTYTNPEGTVLRRAASVAFSHSVYEKTLKDVIQTLSGGIEQAIKQGGNCIIDVDAIRQEDKAKNFALFSPKIFHAIKAQNFHFHFQPIYDVADNSVYSYEALIRADFACPARKFIDGIEIMLKGEDRCAVRKALFDKVLADLAHADLRESKAISVNIYLFEIHDDSLFELIKDFAKAITSLGYSLSTEILETMKEEGISAAAINSKFACLRSAGVKISLDDFGVQDSNFSRLIELDIDCVKLDKLLIDGVVNDKKSRAVVVASKTLCDFLDLELIAEGVETREQRDILLDLGIVRHQGYYYSR